MFLKGGHVKDTRKRVCILGTAETMGMAPFEDEGIEIWAHAMCVDRKRSELKRYDKLFEMHSKWKWMGRVDQLTEGGRPVIMQRHFDEVPESEAYPLEDVLKFFKREYMTNSVSQMVALAIMQGYQEIGLFGVHMAVDSEYAFERPNLEYYLGHAEARGIEIWLPDEASILKANYLYGYEENKSTALLLGIMHDAEEKVTQFSQQELSARDSKHQAMGWRECVKQIYNLESH